MNNNTRVFNETRRFWTKHKQAAQAVENCACAWIVFGASVRDLTLAESIAARNLQAASRDPLPSAELLGLWYEAEVESASDEPQRRKLSRVANCFMLSQSGV